MPNLHYNITGTPEEGFVTVYVEGQRKPLSARSDNVNFAAIVQGLLADDPNVLDLFDTETAIARKFEALAGSDAVSVRDGRVYFDGEEVNSSLTRQIIAFLSSGADFGPLVRFMENVYHRSPSETEAEFEHRTTQLFDWLNNREGITITDEGLILGYKGVYDDGNGGYVSGSSGYAIVDGEEVNGRIPNAVGSTVEMPRRRVQHDPSVACSTGLHVGTYQYAQSYARGAMLAVLVHPADVVSVPSDGGGEKIRVCRYRVESIIEAPETSPLYGYSPEEAFEGLDFDPEFEDAFEGEGEDAEQDSPASAIRLLIGFFGIKPSGDTE